MSCSPFDLKDFFFGELNEPECSEVSAHLERCAGCREELDRLRLTQAGLRSVHEEDPPRRIAFVSDKVFEPRWWQRAFNQIVRSPTFAAGVLVAAAILIHGAMRPGQALVDAAVTKAVSQMEARHAQELQVMYEQLELRDKQVSNMYLTNAALIR
jgi:anti-sigma factor RsiW